MQKTFIGITAVLFAIAAYLVSVKLTYRNESGIHGQTIWIFIFATILSLAVVAVLSAINKRKI